MSKFNLPNKVSWRNIRGVHQYKICAICDETAERITCEARKLVEYDYTTRVASVYHMGYHKCWPKVGSDTDQLLGHVQKLAKRKGSAKEVAVEEISTFIDSGDMDGAECEADVWVDHRKVKRTIESLKPNAGADENSFDAVALLKQKTDKTRLETSNMVTHVIMYSSFHGKWLKLQLLWMLTERTICCN